MDIQFLYSQFLNSSGVSTDTRKIEKDCIFFALKGDNFDGNKFADEALELGALLAVVDDSAVAGEKKLLVSNALKALQELAVYHRRQLNTPLIALTGSNGKTTTKELIHAVLAQKFNTLATLGNLNNHIGVPLTLLRLKPNTEIGIIEMGANHPGEIQMLSEIAQPNFGYITNFGKAHLEGFGSLEGVIQGKTELYRFIQQSGGKLFVNGLDFQQIKQSEGIERHIFGPEDSEYPVALIDASESLIIKFRNIEMHSQLGGVYNFENMAAAVAIGAYMGMTASEIRKGIESYTPKNHRSQIITRDSNTIIMDAYNANPTSMMAALENFRQKESYNKILFLGDMFELGPDAGKEHQAIVDYIQEHFNATTYLIGENFAETGSTDPFIQKFRTFESIKKELKDKKPQDALILIKGSRGMALERILDWI